MRKVVLIAGTINHHPDTDEVRYVHLDGDSRPIFDEELQLFVQPDLVMDLASYLPDLRDNMFDEIVCDHVFEHLTQDGIKLALTAFRRILKDAGTLIVETPNMDAIARCWVDGVYKQTELQQWIHGEDLNGPFDGHRYSYSPTSLRQTIENGGFRVKEEEERGLAIRMWATPR